MKFKGMDVCSQSKTISLASITLIIFFTMTQRVHSADEQNWQSVSEHNYHEVLSLVALCSKANYDAISSWQGLLNIFETNHYYGSDAAKMSNADISSPASNSQYILEEIRGKAEFALDTRNNKLYSKNEKPVVRLKAIDLGQNVPVRNNGEYMGLKAILTTDIYIWYMPDGKFRSNSQKNPDKMVFIDKPEERKFNLSGDIRDPRVFFESSGDHGRKLWDTLFRINSTINERINKRIEGFPHIQISSLETDQGTKYRILTTWKGIKYIRCLLEVDEMVNFNTTKIEITNPDGVKTESEEYTYEKIGEVYLPKTVRKEYRNSKGAITRISEITIETTNMNKPLPEDTFTIKNLGIEEGTLVSDKIKKTEFQFIKGSLVPVQE